MRRHHRQQQVHSDRVRRVFWENDSLLAVLVVGALLSGPVIFNVSIALNRHCSADDAAKPQAEKALPEADEEEWRALFDGKTLADWKSTNFGGEGDVYVKDGVLGFTMGNPLTGVTWTGAELPKVNYEVQFEGRRVDGGDFFCALTFPYQDTYASLILGGWGGAVIGMSSINGYDASENETSGYYKFEKGQWYKIRLKVTDNTISGWIGDEEIFDIDTEEKTIDTRIEVDPSKPFGFCSFETQGEIRNIKLREVKPGNGE